MSSTLTYDQWEWLEEKYGRLLHHIAYRIGGDSITNDHDASYQELSIAMMDTVEIFDKHPDYGGGKKGGSFEEYKNTPYFDKYLKTVLWNRKNNLGGKIVKRTPLRRQVTLDEQLLKEKCNRPIESFELFGNEELAGDLSDLVSQIEQDGKVIKASGDFNVSRLCRNLGKTKAEVKHTIARLKHELKTYDEFDEKS